MDKFKNMDRTDLRNKFIIFNKIMVGLLILELIIIIVWPLPEGRDEIDLGIWVIPMILLAGIAVISFLITFILEMIASIKLSGTTIIGSMLIQIVVMFVIFYFADKWILHENESTWYWMLFSMFIVCFQKIPEYWKRYDREYAKKNKNNK